MILKKIGKRTIALLMAGAVLFASEPLLSCASEGAFVEAENGYEAEVKPGTEIESDPAAAVGAVTAYGIETEPGTQSEAEYDTENRSDPADAAEAEAVPGIETESGTEPEAELKTDMESELLTDTDAEVVADPGTEEVSEAADEAEEVSETADEVEEECVAETGEAFWTADDLTEDIQDPDALLEGYMEQLISDSLRSKEGSAAGLSDEYVPDQDSDSLPDEQTEESADASSDLPQPEEPDGNIQALGSSRYDSADMTSVHRRVYSQLKAGAASIAAGKTNSSVFNIPVSRLGLSKSKFSAKDLGLTAQEFTRTGTGGALYFTDEAKNAATARIREQIALIAPAGATDSVVNEYASNRLRILYSLRADLPYELYWFAGNVDWYFTPMYSGSTSYISCSSSYLTIKLNVLSAYRVGSMSYTVDTDNTSRASAVVKTAMEVVEAADEECIYDAEKLDYYRARIWEYAPVTDFKAESGGPMCQVINIFDGKTSTHAGSEGYARAFKYLCDLTSFRYPDFDCYLMSGTRNSVKYMWNSVRMDDGLEYLVDIPGAGSEQASLMLGKYSSHAGGSNSYTYTYAGTSDNPQQVTYIYDTATTSVFAADELLLSDEDYDTDRRYLGGDLFAVFETAGADDRTPAYEYTGKAIKPVITVYNVNSVRGDILRPGTDYTVKYTSNKKAGRACITVKGKGNYTSSAKLYFDILPVDMSEVYTDPEIVINETGKYQKPSPKVYWKGKVLKAGRDYTVEYFEKGAPRGDMEYTLGKSVDSVKEAGEYILRITGEGNFDEETYTDVMLNVADVPDKPRGVGSLTVSGIKAQPYTEDEHGLPIPITPEITVKDGKKVLRPYTDESSEYDYKIVSYSRNTSVGTGYVFIEGDGVRYTGARSIPFKITGTSLSKAKIYGLPSSVPYTGSPVDPTGQVRIYVGNKELKPYTYKSELDAYTGDVSMTLTSNVLTGKATVTFTGHGAYTGSLKKTFKITKRGIDTTGITVSADAAAVYAKSGAKPHIIVKDGSKTLTEGVDYTCSYSGNKKISSADSKAKVTIKGKGNYKGSRYEYYSVVPADLAGNVTVYAPDIAVSKDKAGNYKSSVTITDTSGSRLKIGKDVTVKYYRCSAADYLTLGSAAVEELDSKSKVSVGDEVTVVAYAHPGGTVYTGNTETSPFSYRVLSQANDLGKKGVFKVASQDYTGNAVTLDKSDFTVAKPYSKSTDTLNMGVYDAATGTYPSDCDFIIIGYSNNIKKGKAKVTLRGVNDYSGTKTVTFKIGAKKFFHW